MHGATAVALNVYSRAYVHIISKKGPILRLQRVYDTSVSYATFPWLLSGLRVVQGDRSGCGMLSLHLTQNRRQHDGVPATLLSSGPEDARSIVLARNGSETFTSTEARMLCK